MGLTAFLELRFYPARYAVRRRQGAGWLAACIDTVFWPASEIPYLTERRGGGASSFRLRSVGGYGMTDAEIDERIARAMEPRAFDAVDAGYTQINIFERRAFLNAEKVVKRARKKARAAREAYEAALAEAGFVIAAAPRRKPDDPDPYVST